MSTGDPSSRGFSLKRWSQRKLEATRAAAASAPEAAASARDAAQPQKPHEVPPATPPAAQGIAAAQVADAPPLPPVESLTIDSDFSAFLDPKVDQAVKLQALKKLFRDPRFNVMDGLDVYIDDYSIADPIAPDVVRQLAQARYIFDPPSTRVNEAGIVEDVPADEARAGADAEPPEPPPEARAVASPPTAPSAAPDAAEDAASGDAQSREAPGPAQR